MNKQRLQGKEWAVYKSWYYNARLVRFSMSDNKNFRVDLETPTTSCYHWCNPEEAEKLKALVKANRSLFKQVRKGEWCWKVVKTLYWSQVEKYKVGGISKCQI